MTFVGDCRLQERIWVWILLPTYTRSLILVYVGKRIHNRHINAQITTMVEQTKQNIISCTTSWMYDSVVLAGVTIGRTGLAAVHLANRSTISLPGIPEWPGIHWTVSPEELCNFWIGQEAFSNASKFDLMSVTIIHITLLRHREKVLLALDLYWSFCTL